MTAQEIYDNACVKYNEAMDILEEIGVNARKEGMTFSTDILKREYDEMLQAMLLDIAISDGSLDDVELQFIEMITDRGDILIRVNKLLEDHGKGMLKLSWKGLGALNNDTNKQIAKLLDTVAKESISDSGLGILIGGYREEDGEDSLAKKLMFTTGTILASLACIDGNSEQIEQDTALEKIHDLFFDSMSKVAKDALEEAEDDTAGPQGTKFVGGKK